VPLGYDVVDKRLVLNEEEARTVRHIYTRYLALGCVRKLKSELDAAGHVSKVRETEKGLSGGRPFSRGALYKLLKNPLYIGKITHKGTNHEGQHAAAVDSQLWQQVQIKLSSNRLQKTRKTLAKNPALLAGLLHDDRGNPMSPTHATKGNRRYRYYISQAVLQFRGTEAGSVVRISAQPLENAVIGQIKQLLGDSLMLLDALSSVELSAPLQTRLITAAKSLVDGWERFHSSQIIDLIKTLIRKIVLSKEQVRITRSRVALVESLMGNKLTDTDSNALHQAPDEYVVTIPVNLKRCGLETRLIIPGEMASQAHARTATAVQDALAKALAWNQALITGTASSMTELGKQEGVTQQYIAQVIKLAFLSPDIMKAIIRGDIPSTLTLDILKKGFPLDWDKQRQMLGFTHRPPSNPTGKIGI
jgi:site-specific DNA recombinase